MMNMLNDEDLEKVTGGVKVIRYNFQEAARKAGVKKADIGEMRLRWMDAGCPEPEAWLAGNYTKA